MVLGMLLDSFISSTLGMTKPVLSSRSRATRSRQANSPAQEMDVEQLACERPDAGLVEAICSGERFGTSKETHVDQCVCGRWQPEWTRNANLQRQPAAGV